jgi:7-cyano-7-deazaguanine synthase|tara:strand:- start:71567 stop:72301 length:735 start_codon:yes stop_codon:yes gene_type:complete
MKKALVVLSGGQDSTTCLFWAMKKGYECSAITFNYNQLHSLEVESSKKVATMANLKNHIILDLGSIFDGDSPLTNFNKKLELNDSLSKFSDGMQKTFIPSRNIVFLSLASNYAYSIGAEYLVTGICQTDYAGYPDCRGEFIQSLEQTISLGLDKKIEILTPLLDLKKYEIVNLAFELGKECWNALAYTHTSYCGKFPPSGKDHASLLRARGFEEAGLPDPLILRAYEEGLVDLPKTKNYESQNK